MGNRVVHEGLFPEDLRQVRGNEGSGGWKGSEDPLLSALSWVSLWSVHQGRQFGSRLGHLLI